MSVFEVQYNLSFSSSIFWSQPAAASRGTGQRYPDFRHPKFRELPSFGRVGLSITLVHFAAYFVTTMPSQAFTYKVLMGSMSHQGKCIFQREQFQLLFHFLLS